MIRRLTPQEETTPGSGRGLRMPPFGHILAVGVGGALGAVMRHAFILAFPDQAGGFPFVTFAENVVGSFLLGVVLISLLRAPALGERWRPFLATGVLGSFTTFSNVSVQFVELALDGATPTAILYLTLSMATGLLAAAAGIALGVRLMTRFRPAR